MLFDHERSAIQSLCEQQLLQFPTQSSRSAIEDIVFRTISIVVSLCNTVTEGTVSNDQSKARQFVENYREQKQKKPDHIWVKYLSPLHKN